MGELAKRIEDTWRHNSGEIPMAELHLWAADKDRDLALGAAADRFNQDELSPEDLKMIQDTAEHNLSDAKFKAYLRREGLGSGDGYDRIEDE